MAVTLYGKGEGWFETSPYGVMADMALNLRGGRFGWEEGDRPIPPGDVQTAFQTRSRAGMDSSLVMPSNHSMTSVCRGMPLAWRSCSSSYSESPG